MANSKLMKVMEYLINEQEDKAQELLHQIFIEKARAIHEEMMHDQDLDEVLLGGDQEEDFEEEIRVHGNEIDSEEYYAEGMHHMNDDEDMDADAVEDLGDELEISDEDADDVADTDEMDVEVSMDDDHDEEDQQEHDHEDDDENFEDLQDALEQLRQEFQALKAEVEHDHTASDDHADKDVEESWEADLDEEFDSLSENIDLETVSVAKGGEVGSGKFARAEVSTHSPVPTSQKEQMGARPVVTGKGPHASGYDLQSAPKSESMGAKASRKKAQDGMSAVSKEGDSSAMLNKATSQGFGSMNTRSPISGH